MPNKNYVKGRNKEYSICRELKKEGYDIVQRSAGSHSPIDVFAINKALKKIKFVQSKPDNFAESAKKKILEECGWMRGYFWVEFELI